MLRKDSDNLAKAWRKPPRRRFLVIQFILVLLDLRRDFHFPRHAVRKRAHDTVFRRFRFYFVERFGGNLSENCC